MPTSVAEVFAEIPKRFDPDAWGSEDAVLAFDVTGEGAVSGQRVSQEVA